MLLVWKHCFHNISFHCRLAFENAAETLLDFHFQQIPSSHESGEPFSICSITLPRSPVIINIFWPEVIYCIKLPSWVINPWALSLLCTTLPLPFLVLSLSFIPYFFHPSVIGATVTQCSEHQSDLYVWHFAAYISCFSAEVFFVDPWISMTQLLWSLEWFGICEGSYYQQIHFHGTLHLIG